MSVSGHPATLSRFKPERRKSSIHLSNNKTVELDNVVCSWVLSYKTTGWMRSFHIFLYSFCHYTIRNDLKTISQYQKFTKFWKWSAACVIIRIKGTGSFVPPSLANWSFVFRWSISRSSPAKTIEKKKKKEKLW